MPQLATALERLGTETAFEVLARAELGGIDEVGDDDAAGFANEGASLSNEGGVPLVQRSHRHDDRRGNIRPASRRKSVM